MFTDRFIKLPISIEKDDVNDNLGEKNPEVRTYLKITPLQIESYRPTYEKGDEPTPENLNKVAVMTKNGDNFYIHMSIEKFEKLLNDFDK